MPRHFLHISLAIALALGSLGSKSQSWAQSSVGVRPGSPPTPGKPALKPPAEDQERVKIFSDRAIYKRQEKKAQAIGHVKIIQDNTTIFADDVLYNEADKQSFVEDGVKIIQVNKKEDKGSKS